MVHTELPEWPCPDCGKKFKRKFDLNRHRVTVHLGVRNFPCDLCGKRFADMKDMTRHKNAVHYGMKIKWNSRKVKGEGGGGSRSGRGPAGKAGHRMRREQREMSSSSAEVKLEDGSQVDVLFSPPTQKQLTLCRCQFLWSTLKQLKQQLMGRRSTLHTVEENWKAALSSLILSCK